ncbi:MAG: tetratricopeptide repeat protein [Candidatus Eremiobacteraeota bacterium]|nr:tetratricopeptide repeat protein [Candidatus Eremiobacteraeota bacterium]
MGKRLGTFLATLAWIACASLAPAAAASPPIDPKDVNTLELSSSPSDPQGAIQQAREKIAAGDLRGAIDELATYVGGHPLEVAPARFLGDLYYRAGQFGQAESIYSELVMRHPNDRETHNRLGVLYATQDRINDAIAQFDQAMDVNDSVSDLVEMHVRKGDIEQYVDRIRHAAAQSPADSEAQAEAGEVFSMLHDEQQAMQYYMRALQDDSNSVAALNGLGLIYLDLHNVNEAEKDFSACMKVDPQDYACENNLASAYLHTGEDAKAEAAIANAFHWQPERPEALVNYGYLADLRGDWKKAVAYYVQATVVGPYLPESYVDLGIDYEQNHMFQLAESALLKGIAAAPHDGRLHYLLAVAYVAQHKTSLALDQLQLAERDYDPDVVRIAQEETARISKIITLP